METVFWFTVFGLIFGLYAVALVNRVRYGRCRREVQRLRQELSSQSNLQPSTVDAARETSPPLPESRRTLPSLD